MAYQRTLLETFMLPVKLYAGASVTFYVVANNLITATKATLYDSPAGGSTLANPQTLDGQGKAAQPIYFAEQIIAVIDATGAGDQQTGIITPHLADADAQAATAVSVAGRLYLEANFI